MAARSRKRGRRTKPAAETVARPSPAGETVARAAPATGRIARPGQAGPAVGAGRAVAAAGTATAERPAGRARATARSAEEAAAFRERVGQRYEERNAAVRATIEPLAAGERPSSVMIAVALAAALGIGNLIAYAAGAKINGRHPAPEGIIVFSFVMIVCAIGMWRMWNWAVLVFEALLAIIATLFTLLLLLRANDVLGYTLPPVVIIGCGWLFAKLVRVLSRMQMPRYPEP